MGCAASAGSSNAHTTPGPRESKKRKNKYEEEKADKAKADPTPTHTHTSDKERSKDKPEEKTDKKAPEKRTPKEKSNDKSKDKNEKSKDKNGKKKEKGKEKGGRFKANLGSSGQGEGTEGYRKGKKGRDKRLQILSTMNQVSPFAEDLAPYVPWTVLKQFKIDPTMQSDFASFPGVVMLVDMTGFTRLGENLSKLKGLLGVELLAAYINGYFTKLINIVDEYGGSVERFAGDALIVVFGSPFCHSAIEVLNAQAVACAMAIQKRHGVFIAEISKDSPGENDEELTVHIGIGASLVKTITVGGLGDSWRKILFGTVFDQLAAAVPIAKPGEVVISQQCMTYLESTKDMALYETQLRCSDNYLILLKEGENVPTGVALPKITLTTAMEKGVRGFIDLFVQSRIDEGQPEISETRNLSLLFMGVNGWPQIQEEMNSMSCAGFAAIHQLIRSIQSTVYTYEGCIANCLVDEKGFIIIVTYGMPQHSDDPLLAVKSAIEIKESGEKLGIGLSIAVTTGNTFVGTIGSKTRRDYTIMGAPVNLGARLMSVCENIWELTQEGDKTPALATSSVSSRVGPKSAGIDGKSEASSQPQIWSQILVDEKTFKFTKKTCLFQTDLDPLEIRGYTDKVPIYSPKQIFKGRRDFAAYQKNLGEEGGEDMFNEDEERRIVKASRATELRALEAIRDEVCSDMKQVVKTRVVFVYGEGGSGKSYLIRICGQPIVKNEMPGTWLESCQNDNSSGDSAYAVWEPIFTQLLMRNIPSGVTKAQHIQKFFETLSQGGDWMEFGYLNLEIQCFMAMMNPVLKTQFREPQGLADLGPALRAKTTVSLLHIILKHHSRIQPLYLLFDQMENCHDLQSLELIWSLAASKDKRNPIMVFCSLRPAASSGVTDTIARAECSRLVMKMREFTQSVTTVTLKPLTQELATELFIHLLNAELQNNQEIPVIKECDPDLAFFVYKNSQNGKTFLLVAIVNSFRDELVGNTDAKTALAVTGARLHMVGDDDSALALHLPESVTHFARSTVDRLPATQQLIVKYASVVGKKDFKSNLNAKQFTLESLSEIFPIQKSRNALLHGVLKLVELRLLVEVKDDGDTAYRFADGIVQDEAYGMVLQEQRKTIHKKLAELTEKKHLTDAREQDGTDLEAENMAQLARHWSAYVRLSDMQSSSEDIERAIFCLKRHAHFLVGRTEHAGAYDMLRTAQRFLVLLRKKSSGDEDELAELEVELLGEMTSSVQNARLRFPSNIILNLHRDLLAVEIENVTDSIWEMRYRALCGSSIELARTNNFAQAHETLRRLAQVTAEAGGEIESIMQSCTVIQVLSASADNVADLIEISKETLEMLNTMKDQAIFHTLSTFFSGMSTGHPMQDVLCALKLAYTLQGNFHLAEGLEEAILKPEKGQSLNEARVHCLACSTELMAQSPQKARRWAEHALELASKTGDHFSVALANFYLTTIKGIPEEAYSSLKVLENAVGLMYEERCLLLEAVAEGDCHIASYADLLEDPPKELFWAPELRRLQAIALYKLWKEDETSITPFVSNSNETNVLQECETRFIDSINGAKGKGQIYVYIHALASLLRFWNIVGVEKGGEGVASEIWKLKEKMTRTCPDLRFKQVLGDIDALVQGQSGSTGSFPDAGLTPRSLDDWNALIH